MFFCYSLVELDQSAFILSDRFMIERLHFVKTATFVTVLVKKAGVHSIVAYHHQKVVHLGEQLLDNLPVSLEVHRDGLQFFWFCL